MTDTPENGHENHNHDHHDHYHHDHHESVDGDGSKTKTKSKNMLSSSNSDLESLSEDIKKDISVIMEELEENHNYCKHSTSKSRSNKLSHKSKSNSLKNVHAKSSSLKNSS